MYGNDNDNNNNNNNDESEILTVYINGLNLIELTIPM